MVEPVRGEVERLEGLYAEDPDGLVFTELSAAYLACGEVAKAREVLAAGLERHTDCVEAYVVLGRIALEEGDVDEAGEALRRALELDARHPGALRSLANLELTAGRLQEALRCYEDLLSVAPEDEELRRIVSGLRGERAATAGDASGGVQADGIGAEEGLIWPGAWAAGGEHANADPVVTETAGDLYARQGLHDRAAVVYARLLEERPDDANLQEKYEDAREAAARRTGHEAVGERGRESSEEGQRGAATTPARDGQDSGDATESEATTSLADEVDALWDQTESGADAAEPAAAAEREMPVEGSGEIVADEGELEEVEAAWTGGDGAFAAEQTPYAWEEEPAAAESTESGGAVASRSVGEYLRKLLSWRPSSPDPASAEPEPVDRDSGGAGTIWPAASPDLGWEIVERVTTRSSGEESPGEGELGEFFVASKEAETGSGREAREAGAASREQETEPRRESPWDRAASRGRGSGAIERLVSDPRSEAERSAEVLGGTRAEEEDDDDDLEMFRAWLQSLKR